MKLFPINTRRISLSFLLIIGVLLSLSCKKMAEGVIDCLGESLLTSVHITTDNTNSKLVQLEARYHGNYTVTSVFWDYGDGSSATTSGKTSDHTYAASGTYEVKAKVTIVHNKAKCEISPKKSVTIN